VEDILLLNKFFLIVDTCLSCKDLAGQSCVMVPRWRFLTIFLRPVFAASRVQHASDLHLKFAFPMCASMADIHSATAEIRRGKKKKKKNKRQDENIMVCPIP